MRQTAENPIQTACEGAVFFEFLLMHDGILSLGRYAATEGLHCTPLADVKAGTQRTFSKFS